MNEPHFKPMIQGTLDDGITRVVVDGGKYTVVICPDGKLTALRYGEEWRNCVGDKLIYCLAFELNEARKRIETLSTRVIDAEDMVKDLATSRAADEIRAFGDNDMRELFERAYKAAKEGK